MPENGIEIPSTTLKNAAVEAALAGGAVLMDWIGRFSVKEKKRADLVTEADHASQESHSQDHCR